MLTKLEADLVEALEDYMGWHRCHESNSAHSCMSTRKALGVIALAKAMEQTQAGVMVAEKKNGN